MNACAAGGAPPGPLLIGVDVGGTHTDAVRVEDGRIAARAKVTTTPDVESGVLAALRAVGGEDAAARVHVGTTAFTNALVERRGLSPAAAVRVGAPASESLPPLSGWPAQLRGAVSIPVFLIGGGREYDGRPIRPLLRAEVEDVGRSLAGLGVRQVAVTAVFGTSHPQDELQVDAWLRAADARLGVSLSHRIGRFGILERENATLLNAMLRPLAEQTLGRLRAAISGRLFISQNDGTTAPAAATAELPIFTVASGPTNSLRGASLLSGLGDALVVDVGGTTTDVGRLRAGYPQLAGLELEVAGVRTNFRMPDLQSVGIGGGSRIDPEDGSVGPGSVGFRLREEALVFGGSTLTLTDVAAAAGHVAIGDPAGARGVPPELIARVDAHLAGRFERLIEAFEHAGEHLPLVLVGGGAPLVRHIFERLGRAPVQPPDAAVANALGAAVAQVGGEVDLTFAGNAMRRSEALARAEREAHRRACAAGALPSTVRTVELEDAAFTYLAAQALRVRAKAVGDLEVS
jgi:N-methylhydantoinase A/oxoprolinase/acetone carboxylase beta subunit